MDLKNKNRLDIRNKEDRKKAIILLVIVSSFMIAFCCLLQIVLRKYDRVLQDTNNNRFFSTVINNLENNEEEMNSLTDGFHENNLILLDDLVKAFSKNIFNNISEISVDEQVELFDNATKNMYECSCLWMFVIDENSEILISNYKEDIGYHLVDEKNIEDSMLSAEDFEAIKKDAVRYFEIDNPYIKIFSNDELWVGYDNIDPEEDLKDEFIESFGEKMYLYCRAIPGTYSQDGRKYVVLGFGSNMLDKGLSRMQDVANWIDGTSIGNNGIALIVDKNDGTIKYCSKDNELWKGYSINDYGILINANLNKQKGIQKINGVNNYVSTMLYSSELYGDNYIVSVVPTADLYSGNISITLWNLSLLMIVIILVAAYSAIVRMEMINNKEDLELLRIFGREKKSVYLCRALAKKVVPITISILILMFAASFYIQALMKISDAFVENVNVETYISDNITGSADVKNSFTNFYDMQNVGCAQLLSFMVSLHADDYFDTSKNAVNVNEFRSTDLDGRDSLEKDDYKNVVTSISNSEALKNLANDNKLENIYLFDDSGRTIATSSSFWNFRLSYNPEDQSYPFWDVLLGKEDYLVQEPMVSEVGVYSQYIACPFYYYTCLDDEGNTRYVNYIDYHSQINGEWEGNKITKHTGLLEIEIKPENLVNIVESADIEYILNSTKISNDGLIIGFKYNNEKDIYEVVYSSSDALDEATSDELGIDRSSFENDYNGFQRINGRKYLQSIRLVGDYYVSTAIPLDALYSSCYNISLISVIFTLLVLIAISYYTVMVVGGDEEELRLEGEDPLHIFGHFKNQNVSSGFKTVKTKTNAQKFEELIKNSLAVLGVLFLISIMFEARRFGNNSAISYILSGKWDRGVHIFSVSACVVIMIIAVILIKIISFVVRLAVEPFGNRIETIMHLFTGILKAGGIIVALFYCLYLFGIDATKLLASAGIITAVVGLGAQNTVSDLLAGIMIVMEGSIHVGDYIYVDDFRGIITDIGLRTTKFEDTKQNVKIVCNSELKALVNMSKKYTFIEMNIPVPYEEDVEALKYILNAEFLDVYTSNSMLKSVPKCQGIQEFSESSIDIRVRVLCDEKERTDVERYMHDQIYRIFRENNITIPFNQLDVHFDNVPDSSK